MNRQLLIKLHRWLAASIGLFIVVMGVTGSILAFQDNLDRLFHAQLSYVTPQPRVLSFEEIAISISNKFPKEPIVAWMPSPEPTHSWQVALASGMVYVNPYSGEVLGVRERGQTFFGIVRAFHVRLSLGNLGRNIVRWVDLLAIILLLSGAFLWWPAKLVKIRKLGLIRTGWFHLHNTVGILSLIFLGVLTVTGAVIGFEDILSTVRPSDPRPIHPLPIVADLHHSGQQITPDEAVTIARTLLPGAIPYRIQMPNYGGLYRISMTETKNWLSTANDFVAIDPYGKILSISRSQDLSARDRILAANEAIHTGTILGTPGKVVMSFSSLMILVLALSGALMWWMRTGKKRIEP